MFYICTPQEDIYPEFISGTIIEKLKNKCLRNKIKNYFKKACQKEKDAYFCTRFET